jgi:hypothetical protein
VSLEEERRGESDGADARSSASGGTLAGGAPRKEGLSGGAKLALGCAAVVALFLLIGAVLLGAGGLFLKHKVGDLAQGAQLQEQASVALHRLEQKHRFRPPDSGLVGVDRSQAFLAVVDDAWRRMDDVRDDLTDLQRRLKKRDPGVLDMAGALHNMAGVMESRTILADALERHDMPLSEFVWTGLTLERAYRRLDDAGGSSRIVEGNLEVARRNREALAQLYEYTSDDSVSKGVVLGLAAVWGLGEVEAWRSMGLDTMWSEMPR